MVNRWTPLTLLAVFFVAGTTVNVLWHLSVTAVVGGGLAWVVGYWVIGGCARRGDPVARWLIHRRTFGTR